MKVNNNNKKGSNAKKIIPAVGMLSVSAVMLASSTFAWFTMSREVEVNNIKLTATVPEDLQISLGTLGSYASSTYTAESSESGVSLGANTGILIPATGNSNASNGGVMEPTHTWDWSNTADISNYYEFGRLIPASSTTGVNIFYTPDASGVGKTVKDEASYYQAAAANVAYGTNFTVDATSGAITYAAASASATSARATVHAFTTEHGDAWKLGATADSDYTQAVDWKTTKDDGYYADVPIWIRTSSNADVPISVDGYVLPGKADAENGSTYTELELYKAVRVAILNEDGTAANSTGNILPLKDAWDTNSGKGTDALAGKYISIVAKANKFAADNASILDSANLAVGRVISGASGNLTYDSSKKYGVSASATDATTGADTVTKYYKGTYAEYTPYAPTNATAATKTIATIQGSGTTAQYGAMKKLIIRVWLDGEDGECWNDNAGQDWAISLKFSKIES